MRRSSIIVLLALLGAACSGNSAEPTTTRPTATTSTSTAATTTTVAAEPCTQGLPENFGVNTSGFDIVQQGDVFACFNVTTFRSSASYRGTAIDPAVPDSRDVTIETEQTIEGSATPRARTTITTSDATYVTLVIDDAVYTDAGDPLTDQIPVDVFSAEGSLSSILAAAVVRFAVLVVPLEDETVAEIDTTHHRADGAAIARDIEESIARVTGESVVVEIPETSLDIWADDRGLIIQLTFTFSFDAATVDGVPVAEATIAGNPAYDYLPGGTGTLRYALSDFNAPITVELP